MKVKEFIKNFLNDLEFQDKIMNNLNSLKTELKREEFKNYEGMDYIYHKSIFGNIKKIQKKSKMPTNKRFKK